jgi:crotonobetainyl-CoA:carnitine CoA-transferase CaiB-like acyl-CoA transferase
MGAEVIKVERPGKGDDCRHWGPPFVGSESAYFLCTNRNKKSITLDLKTERGKKILRDLVRKSDVLIENFRPGTLDRLGFSYPAVQELNPRIIYCSISGYGQTGPLKNKPAYDLIIQGESGLMSITGFPDGPPTKVGVSISDLIAGFYALQGILLALMVRSKTNKGQKIDVSILDSVVSILTYRAANYFAGDEVPKRKGNDHPTLVPYEAFKVKDGYINIGVANDSQWKRLCAAIEREDLAEDPRFVTNRHREKNRRELKSILDLIIARQSREYWLRKLKAEGVPCGAINHIDEVMQLEQVKARGMVVEMWHPAVGPIKVLGFPVKLSETPGRMKAPPPVLGEHTVEILQSLGYNDHEIREMQEAGIV